MYRFQEKYGLSLHLETGCRFSSFWKFVCPISVRLSIPSHSNASRMVAAQSHCLKWACFAAWLATYTDWPDQIRSSAGGPPMFSQLHHIGSQTPSEAPPVGQRRIIVCLRARRRRPRESFIVLLLVIDYSSPSPLKQLTACTLHEAQDGVRRTAHERRSGQGAGQVPSLTTHHRPRNTY